MIPRILYTMSVTLVVAAATPAIAAENVGSAPVIVAPRDGAIVTSPVDVVIDLKAATVAGHKTAPMGGMAGMPGMTHGHEPDSHGGHAHLIIDSLLPKSGAMVPVDARHIHLMGGETRTRLSLPPGQHTLQVIMGGFDHRVPADAPTSAKVTITVKSTTQ